MSKQGIILIEMLISIFVISIILLMIMNFISLFTNDIIDERLLIKRLQLDPILISDYERATNVELSDQCLIIDQNDNKISYCADQTGLTRKVNDAGYERIISGINVKYLNGDVITISLNSEGDSYETIIWE